MSHLATHPASGPHSTGKRVQNIQKESRLYPRSGAWENITEIRNTIPWKQCDKTQYNEGYTRRSLQL